MRVIFYYRSTDPRIIGAKAMDNTRALRIEAEAKAFADQFGAVPVFTQGFNPRFAGLTFNKGQCKDRNLWTTPTPQNPVMVPRSPEALNKHHKEPGRQLQERFRKLWPAEAAKEYDSHLLTVLGISTAATFGNAVSYFYDQEQVSWIATSLPLTGQSLPYAEGELEVRHALEGWEEVLASQFDKARFDFERRQQEAALAQAQNDAPEAE